MALEWGKQFTFSGMVKSKPKAKTTYPEKTYMNLAVRDARTVDLRKTAIVGVVVLIVAALVLKFGILDFYDRVHAKEVELAEHNATLSALQTKLVNYDAVLEEFEAYGSSRLSADSGSVSALEAMGLVDRVIRPQADVLSLNLTGNTLTMRLSNIKLDNVGNLVSQLNNEPMVANVNVSTAATPEKTASDVVTAAMTITLQRV